MNRHQSNPFLADWDDDHNGQEPSSSSSGKKSDPFGAQRSASIDKGKLYHRNMSSFEAASLQLEQHEQLKKSLDNSSSINQTELIAKMTADFESAINNGNIEDIDGVDFGAFDPFETIIDDDVSITSSTPGNVTAATSTSRANDATLCEHVATVSDSKTTIQKPVKPIDSTKHDSIDDDDEEFVSTPVRNIKSSSLDRMRKANDSKLPDLDNQTTIDFDESQSFSDKGTGNKIDTLVNQDSIAKATIFASLMASAEGSVQINFANQDESSTLADQSLYTDQANESQNSKSPDAAHVLSDVDRSVAFFDPFETVIDKDTLFSYNNQDENGEDIDNSNANKMQACEFDNYINERVILKIPSLDYCQDEADSETDDQELRAPQPTPTHHVSTNASIGEESEQNETNECDRSDESKEPMQTDAHEQYKSIPRPRLTPKQTNLEAQAIITVKSPKKTPKKNAKEKKKISANEDSDDSSDEDRIQILIKSHDLHDQSRDTTNSTTNVPLLPPPPSKISMRQARERGKVNDISSPPRNYKKRVQSDSDSDSSVSKTKFGSGGKPTINDELSIKTDHKLEENNQGNNADINNEGDDCDDQNDSFIIRMNDADKDEDFEKPDSPLYDDDTSYALEDFPQKCSNQGWHMMLRYPPKKNWASTRFWKNIFVKLSEVPIDPKTQQNKNDQSTCIALQVFDKPDDKKPIQDIPIQPTYTVSDISSQQFDQFGKIFTIKIQYIFYKERIGVRQGQLARFMHTGHIGTSTTSGGHGTDAISIGSLKHYGAPIEHSPQVSQIIKLGCHSYDDIRQFKHFLEDHLFKMSISREKVLLPYKTEEVQMAVRDETYIEVNQAGVITKQLARVRLFFLSFLNDNPTVEVGINDIRRQGKEIVGRMDILPVMTEEWIRIENSVLHSVVEKEEFENTRLIKLIPPDATFLELMRFRVRPPRNRELPLQVSANMSVTRTKVCINVDVMVPGCTSRKHGQIPCDSIAIRVFIPECWIYFFREEKHFRMGSVKSVNRRPGKVKGIERFLGGGGNQDINDESSLIEVTSGQAKYEHYHHSIVWRATRWPKENQASYVQNSMKIRLPLAAHDKMPDNFNEFIYVEYSMPSTTVSHSTIRSISVDTYDDEKPPEKYVKYSAKFEYKVKMRLAVNLAQKYGELEGKVHGESPIVIMKQQPSDQIKREEDTDDSDSYDDDLK